jgi:uncharacterized membrane protein
MTGRRPDRGLMIVLSYLWPFAVIPLLVSRDNADVQWHAKHGLVLMVAEAIVLVGLVVISGIGTLASFAVGCALSVLIILAVIAFLAVHALAIIKGLNGRRLRVPGVSQVADRF